MIQLNFLVDEYLTYPFIVEKKYEATAHCIIFVPGGWS